MLSCVIFSHYMISNIVRNNPEMMLAAELPFIRNRDIPIKSNNGRTRCICSPSHYRDYCEFQADRISVFTHLNLTQYNGTCILTPLMYV